MNAKRPGLPDSINAHAVDTMQSIVRREHVDTRVLGDGPAVHIAIHTYRFKEGVSRERHGCEREGGGGVTISVSTYMPTHSSSTCIIKSVGVGGWRGRGFHAHPFIKYLQ